MKAQLKLEPGQTWYDKAQQLYQELLKAREALIVETPLGTLSASPASDPTYPGIYLEWGDQQICLVDYTNDKIRLRVWERSGYIDPEYSVDLIRQPEEEE